MGGPSRKSHLAAQERKAQRIAALRTRGGVVDLGEWRKVQQSLGGLRALIRDLPWLRDVRLAVAPEVGFELRVALVRDSPRVRMALPASVDDIPVSVEVVNPAR